jgi:hypothetical protein
MLSRSRWPTRPSCGASVRWIYRSYRTLEAWVAGHAEPSGERIREWYRVAPWDTQDPAAHRTEIAWPIKST